MFLRSTIAALAMMAFATLPSAASAQKIANIAALTKQAALSPSAPDLSAVNKQAALAQINTPDLSLTNIQMPKNPEPVQVAPVPVFVPAPPVVITPPVVPDVTEPPVVTPPEIISPITPPVTELPADTSVITAALNPVIQAALGNTTQTAGIVVVPGTNFNVSFGDASPQAGPAALLGDMTIATVDPIGDGLLRYAIMSADRLVEVLAPAAGGLKNDEEEEKIMNRIYDQLIRVEDAEGNAIGSV